MLRLNRQVLRRAQGLGCSSHHRWSLFKEFQSTRISTSSSNVQNVTQQITSDQIEAYNTWYARTSNGRIFNYGQLETSMSVGPIEDLTRLVDFDKIRLAPVGDLHARTRLVDFDKIRLVPVDDLHARQLEMEEMQVEEAAKNYRLAFDEMKKIGKVTSMSRVKKLLMQWYEPLVEALELEMGAIFAGEYASDRAQYGPYLRLLDVDKLAVITLDTVLNCIIKSGNEAKIAKIALEIASVIESEVYNERVKGKSVEDSQMDLSFPEDKKEILQKYLLPMEKQKNLKAINLINRKIRTILADEEWASAPMVKLGAKLIYMMIRVAKHEEGGKLVPTILYTKNYYNSGKKHARLMGFLSLPKDVYNKLCKDDGSSSSELSADSSRSETKDSDGIANLDLYLSRYTPMLVPPNRWNNASFGGAYLKRTANLMKVVCSAQKAAVKQAKMKELLDSLDYLGSVGWVINSVLLQVIEEAWRRNILLGDMPMKDVIAEPIKTDPAFQRSKQQIAKEQQEWAEKRQKKKEAKDRERGVDPSSVLPVSAVKVDACSVVAPTEDDHDELVFDEKAFNKLSSQVKQKNAEQLSLRSDFLIKFSIAKKFKDDIIYFPHNLDFRGRAYPVPPNLTHLGSDLCRALLLFSEAKPLGNVGLDWLKVHLSNLFGNNKISTEQRIEWADSHRDDISDSALNPLNGKRWWATAENPFQALATCIEIRNAVDSGDPTTYRCRLPVHQDGSCNGLQHYAGLGRDEVGAAAVNLINHDNPQDVYSRVLEKVLQAIEEGVSNKEDSALLLHGFVDRKVIKQTVMTSVYGVTRIGARAQIQARLTEKLQVDANAIISERQEYEIYCAAHYLAGLTLEALESMFGKAKDIMAWLSECAKLVAKEECAMSWITPLGLPVIQPYRKTHMHTIHTVLQTITLTMYADNLPVCIKKQRTAFPPNYVHSIDATHMLMTCKKMKEDRLAFAAVHDSYWTHACDVPKMNQRLREAFVELYELPLLEDLRDSLVLRFPEVEFPPIPDRGTLDIRAVKDSRYFFH